MYCLIYKYKKPHTQIMMMITIILIIQQKNQSSHTKQIKQHKISVNKFQNPLNTTKTTSPIIYLQCMHKQMHDHKIKQITDQKINEQQTEVAGGKKGKNFATQQFKIQNKTATHKKVNSETTGITNNKQISKYICYFACYPTTLIYKFLLLLETYLIVSQTKDYSCCFQKNPILITTLKNKSKLFCNQEKPTCFICYKFVWIVFSSIFCPKREELQQQKGLGDPIVGRKKIDL
eukprot:TRINITY_DN10438_c0_g1_i2.p3 TRINITY_DN10438_c0_g1~~TRINITY_DN10438_c0_g1_i2.p3  ORF type:complete len:233 (-),score=2.39 TRINITY_DN10438_c0_g1_i2:54-752(-)